LLLLAACGDDMARQPPVDPGDPAAAAGEPVPTGAVPRGWLEREQQILSPDPLPLDMARLQQGREGFETFCSPCHGRTGRGDGMVVGHGFPAPPSFHIDRLREAPRAYVVEVVTTGLGRMPSYADRVEPDERWAIAAYVQALQISQRMPVDELPEEDRARLPGGDS
jgi:mono/diheme cytochrome c family protein